MRQCILFFIFTFSHEIVSDDLSLFLWTTCFKSLVLSCQPVSGCNCIITKLLKFMQKKTLLPQSVHKLKRVWILCLISLCIAPLNAQTLYKIEMPNYILQASGTNTETLYIKNKESENLIQLGKLKFGWTPAITKWSKK